jgi:hypothetical protein
VARDRAEEFDDTAPVHSGRIVNTAPRPGDTELDRRMTRLADERGALFEKAGTSAGLSATEQTRLKAVERELDECFLARRQQRAQVDARRFDRDTFSIRRARPPTP